MSHIPAHRFADAFAGRLASDEVADIDRHVAKCPRCAQAQARVRRASDSFPSLAQRSAPELAWDSVRARVHWAVSRQRREPTVGSPSRRPWFVVGAVAAAGLVAAVAAPRPTANESGASSIANGAPDAGAPIIKANEPIIGMVVRASGESVMVDGIQTTDRELFDRRLGAGTKLATANGELDVQFGEASAFRLAPRSSIELQRFDRDTIELIVDGTVDIAVAPRSHDQRFIVHAGDRAIEVRGTQFRVEYNGGATKVACRHGLVAVRDRSGMLEVGGERALELARDRQVSNQRARALSRDELATLVEATPTTLAVWDVAALATSAPLDIATPGRRAVRVDGIELGPAPLRVRVMPGRHTVEAADGRGRYQRAGWVDVTARTAARLAVLAEPAPAGKVDELRRRQLRAGLDRARIDQCLRKIRMAGMGGTYVQIEIGVDERGAINFLNVLDTDMGQSTAQCISDVLREVHFAAGTKASWRERFDF